MNKYYVYLHTNPLTKKPFYVGKGTGKRAFDNKARNDKWLEEYNSIAEKGLIFEVSILHVCDTEEEALDLETIEIHLRTKAGQTLTNIMKTDAEPPISQKIEEDSIRMFVKIKRKSINLTQKELATRCGVGLRFIRDLEQGKKSLRLDKVNQVLNYFGGSVIAKKLTPQREF